MDIQAIPVDVAVVAAAQWRRVMAMRLSGLAAALALVGLSAVSADAAQITFTGGVVTFLNATTGTTNNSVLHNGNVDFYEEDGFILDFIGGGGAVGNYYGEIGDLTGPQPDNDVIHAHWALGGIGGVTEVQITKAGGGTFDLNYFILTSNTNTGGGPADGTELAYIEGFSGGLSTGAAVLLPPQGWGFPAAQIFLGSAFDAVDTVKFFVTNGVDCFGMDEFFIDEPAPGVPEPSLLLLSGGALAALVARRRAMKK